MNSNLFDPLMPDKNRTKVTWSNMLGCGLSLALVNAARQMFEAPLVVVTPDLQKAMQLERELKLCAKDFPTPLSIHLFPDWETLPYDSFSPHQDIISERLTTLSTMPRMSQGIVIVPIHTMLHRIVPYSFIASHSFVLKKGDKLNLENTQQSLTEACYRRVNEVSEHGEFALRGAILDVFPMGTEQPIRIELFDDDVDTLRYFDPDTQRSLEQIDEIHMLPGREFPFTEEAIKLFRKKFRERFDGNPNECSLYYDISHHIVPAGIEYYLPLFFDHLSLFTDYLPPKSTLVFIDDIHHQAEQFWQSVRDRFDQYRHDRLKPLLQPQELFIPVETLFADLKRFSQINVTTKADVNPFPDLSIHHKAEKPLGGLQAFIDKHPDTRFLLCAESKGRRETLKNLLDKQTIYPVDVESIYDFLEGSLPFGLTVAALDEGYFAPDQNIAIIAESQLYGTQVMQRRRRQKTKTVETDLQIRNIAELQLGDPIVHVDFGVGRYQGLIHMKAGSYDAEFVQIEYAGHDKLYVPIASLHLISKFTGLDASLAPLNRLGSDQWDKEKQKALKRATDVAAELLDIYAKRRAREGFAFTAPDEQFEAFASQFPFEETEDQIKAIDNVIEDMQKPTPMDRLVCGDVGFGKTEVAMRAIFLSVQNNKQVAVLVPTTLLAQQHYETFKDRFAEWPVRIEVLSRFRTKAEQEDVLKKLALGLVDIVIGTHKLIQPDVQFKNLGLVVIDEEHRFGVKQKEILKALRTEVDILTLTATPIPRTLNMAFAEIRDLSIIATPPQKRLSIKTFVREYEKTLIREAALRELMRGGQIYYLYNKVETIQKRAADLQALIPEARIAVAHGQMRERELEKVMADFYHQRFNILVCTTIIETGIDIPSANTIIIEEAHAFGLAQLHQLRGRVGRSHHQAYAYCLTLPAKRMKQDAIKRLEALESLEELGSGFTLATHDLEIRGAGELLGDGQSGHMQSIGFHLYMEILERAVHALQKGENPMLMQPLQHGTEINMHCTALIPETYIRDVQARLLLYKRISHASTVEMLEALQVEMIDRFGLLPEPVKNLFKVAHLKTKATAMGIKKIEASPTGGRILFSDKPNVNPTKIIELIRTQPKQFQMKGSEVLKFHLEIPDLEVRFTMMEDMLNQWQEI